MTRNGWLLASAMALVAQAARVDAQSTPRYTEVYSSDTMSLHAPTLSPDGRWVAFGGAGYHETEESLKLISVNGGTPITMAGTGTNATHPVWFPSGDAIVFRSSHVKNGLMVVHIDPRTGHAVGVPQPITIEPVSPVAYAVSPDGKEIAYGALPRKGMVEIKIVPSTGGTARKVGQADANVVQMYWDASGLQWASATPGGSADFRVFRLEPGGAPRQVARYNEGKGFALIGPTHTIRGARVGINADTLGQLTVTTRAGDTVARFDSKGSWLSGGLNNRLRPTANPGVIMMATAHPRTAVHLAELASGGPREFRPVTETAYADDPAAFTADSRSLYLLVHRNGKTALEIAPLAGGAARSLPLSPTAAAAFPAVGDRVAYVVLGHPTDGARTLQALDLRTGRTQTISDRVCGRCIEPDLAGDQVEYIEANGDKFDVRVYSPASGATTVAALDTAGIRITQFYLPSVSRQAFTYVRAVGDSARLYVQHGDQPQLVATAARGFPYFVLSSDGHALAYATERRDSGVVRVVELGDDARPTGAPRQVTAGRMQFDGLSWSRDGRTLAIGLLHAPDGRDTTWAVRFVSRAGEILRTVDMPRPTVNRETDFVWSKDNKHVYFITDDDAASHMDIWRIATTGNERPASFTTREVNRIWDFILSPDERTVAYAAEVPARETIWKVELPALMARR
jgi:hypothetical protein